MAYQFIIDAGHGGADPGAVYDGRREKDDTLSLALKTGQFLENYGVIVTYTRTTDIYQTPFEKAQIANASGADYFLSIHRNSSEEANQYNGVETLLYDKSGVKLEMAENINAALADLGFKNLGVKERPGLVVLRRTDMPALLVEAGFLNSDSDNALFDETQDEMAVAIADAIASTLGILQQAVPAGSARMQEEPADDGTASTTPSFEGCPPPEILYRVQTGVYRVRENADELLYDLQEHGYPAFILNEDETFKVQVGAYRQLSNAITMERRLREAGYSTFIAT